MAAIHEELILSLAALVGATSALAYSPPIGIPAPSFGIDQVVTMYSAQTYDFGSGTGLTILSTITAGDGAHAYSNTQRDPHANANSHANADFHA